MQTELESLIRWHAAGHRCVLALVLHTWGSAPRQAGSVMAIRADGTFEGSVSGGCIEGTVIVEAVGLFGKTPVKRLTFKVASEQAWEVGLACGGEIEIGLFVMTDSLQANLVAVLACRRQRGFGLLSFDMENGTSDFIRTDGPAIMAETPGFTGNLFQLPIHPQHRLIIIGAVHIAQYLAPMAANCGYDVTVIDPRAAFVESRNFGDVDIVEDWPDEFFRAVPCDATTAVVALTHDPKLDDAGLASVLGGPAFYIGALGSKKTHAGRLERLGLLGFDKAATARIHGPIGLNIGAKTPAEIALSILAEITQSRRLAP